MCGIVGAVAERRVAPILFEGLRRLEYRGYDSAGMAVIDAAAQLQRCRRVGKVAQLAEALQEQPLDGCIGIAHTRWATHGPPCEANAHPHQAGGQLMLVHNGIVENDRALREELLTAGVILESETDSELVAALLWLELTTAADLLGAMQRILPRLEGASSLAVLWRAQPDRIIACRRGSPLVVGVGLGEHFIASDVHALLPVTSRCAVLEEGDIAVVEREQFCVFDHTGQRVERTIQLFQHSGDAADRGGYRHHMLKEIHQQPDALRATLDGCLEPERVVADCFGLNSDALLARVRHVQLVACGTSYHAALIGRYWLEQLGIAASVEVASEYRYREVVTPADSLLVAISQSGETADTLAALRSAQGHLARLAICNVPDSSLQREADLTFLTRAGREIGVASTKAFTTQLAALRLLTLALCRDPARIAPLVAELRQLPGAVESELAGEAAIAALAERLIERHHALFLGRGVHYPVALEGALKLKEISYIHAEAYPAGELKHGPLALVDADMPVIAVMPQDDVLEKLLANLQEVRARGGELLVFADRRLSLDAAGMTVLALSGAPASIAPIANTVPLQLLAYHVAVLRGTDVDQPRNLAKSVTVE